MSRFSQAMKAIVGTASLSVPLGVGFVWHVDKNRYPKMLETYAKGNILVPYQSHPGVIQYFPRPELENKLTRLLQPSFSNEFFLISGEVGSGKTRTVLEVVKRIQSSKGETNQGAPVYVLVSQGSNFIDSLAEAVNFHFDEHISLGFYLEYLLNIRKLPAHDDHNKLGRLLNAIEVSAFQYVKQYGKPVVIVIDDADIIATHMPHAFNRLVEKAKLWADADIVNLVLVSNKPVMEDVLVDNNQGWSRITHPIHIGDLSEQEAYTFLTRSDLVYRLDSEEESNMLVGEKEAREIVNLVGGRLHNLVTFKRALSKGASFEDVVAALKRKERGKLHQISIKHPQAMKVVKELTRTSEGSLKAAKCIELSSEEALDVLVNSGIITVNREAKDTWVNFESQLTENVARDLTGYPR